MNAHHLKTKERAVDPPEVKSLFHFNLLGDSSKLSGLGLISLCQLIHSILVAPHIHWGREIAVFLLTVLLIVRWPVVLWIASSFHHQ